MLITVLCRRGGSRGHSGATTIRMNAQTPHTIYYKPPSKLIIYFSFLLEYRPICYQLRWRFIMYSVRHLCIHPNRGEVLAWLSAGARCRLPYGSADATATLLSLASVKSRLVLPFWYRPTRVVLEKGPLNGCVLEYRPKICRSPETVFCGVRQLCTMICTQIPAVVTCLPLCQLWPCVCHKPGILAKWLNGLNWFCHTA